MFRERKVRSGAVKVDNTHRNTDNHRLKLRHSTWTGFLLSFSAVNTFRRDCQNVNMP